MEGNLRISKNLFDPNDIASGIEISCLVCGTQSYEEAQKRSKYNSIKFKLSELKEPYVCKGCDTEYSAIEQNDHWHISIKLPYKILLKVK